MGPNHRPGRTALLALGALAALAGLASCAKILGVEPIVVDESLQVDASMPPPAACEFAGDCPVLETDPPSCATAECVLGACAYRTVDKDGDGHTASQCATTSAVKIAVGDDCDDGNPQLYLGREADCSEREDGTKISFPGGAPVGSCKLGKKACTREGTVGPCRGAIAPAPVTSCTETIDEGCTGNPMEKCPCTAGQTLTCGTSGVGACMKGVASCNGSLVFGACEGNVEPSARDCASMDDKNCNGTPDKAEPECKCAGDAAPDTKRPCNTHPKDGTGACKAGSQTCTAAGPTSVWSPCTGDVGPQTEQCDNVDRDCDGTPGINEPAPPAPTGTMNCTSIFKCPASGRGALYYRTGVGWTNNAGSNTIWTGYARRGDFGAGTAPAGHYRISRDGTGHKMGPVSVASECCGSGGCPLGNVFYDGAGQFYTPAP